MYIGVIEAPYGALAGVRGPGVSGIGKSLKRVGKGIKKQVSRTTKFKKRFLRKYGNYVAIAAQALNFVVPGLGVAVGAAISGASTAMKARHEAKQMKKAVKAEEVAAARAIQEDAKIQEQKTTGMLDDAYIKGQQYFTQKYNMPAEQWQKQSFDDKVKFMNNVAYDANAKKFEQQGLSREAFGAMSASDQSEAMAKLGFQEKEHEAAELAPGEVDKEDKRFLPTWAWIAMGGAVVLSIPLIAILASRKKSAAALATGKKAA